MKKRRCEVLAFPVDNVLVWHPKGAAVGSPFRQDAGDAEFITGRVNVLNSLREEGHQIVFICNEGGVAFNLLDKDALEHNLQEMAAQVGAKVYVCFHHPSPKAPHPEYGGVDCPDRMPRPGMILRALADAGIKDQPRRMLFVGDRKEYQQAAQAAGIRYYPSRSFFSDAMEEVLYV